MSETKHRDDGPKVAIEDGYLVIVSHDGSWTKRLIGPTWPAHGSARRARRFPQAQVSFNPGEDVPTFRVVEPGRSRKLGNVTVTEDDDVLFEAPDPGGELYEQWQEVIG